MITKLVIKDYVLKRCPYLTKCELSDKSLIELIKNSLLSVKEYKDLLLDEKEMSFDEDDVPDEVLNFVDVIKEHPEFKKELNTFLEDKKLNPVEELINKYTDNQLISKLSRDYISSIYGVKNCYRCDVDEHDNEILDQKVIVSNTQKALKDPNVKVIFEGQVDVDNFRARFDVLIKDDNGKYTLLEVKATNNVCTHPGKDNSIDSKIKEKYLYDLLFQYYVYSKAKMEFNNIGYITLNKKYQLSSLSYPIDTNELCNFFKQITNLNLEGGSMPIIDYFDNYEYTKTKRSPQTSIDEIISDIVAIDKANPEHPKKQYFCRKGPICPLMKYCFIDSDDSDCLFKLSNWGSYGGAWQRMKYLFDMGICKISDIPDKFPDEKYSYNKLKKDGDISNARTQIDMQKGIIKDKYAIDFNGLKTVLSDYLNENVKYLIFFDFESFQHPIPLVRNSTPYKQVVSQYSMHIVERNYDLSKHDFDLGEDGGITHREFIGNPDIDGYENPSINLFKTLKNQLIELHINMDSNDYRVVVFNKNFENTRMEEFIEDFQDICDPLLLKSVGYFKENILDLLDFFTKGTIYSKDFNGKGSLKVVQPMLTSDEKVVEFYKKQNLLFDLQYSLDYHKGDKCLVYNGGICLDLYKSLLIRHHMGEKDIGVPTIQLLEEAKAYCKIDTWSTVIIFDIIKNISEGKLVL